MAIDYTVLKTELNTDPNAYGYAAPRNAGNDVTLAELVNLVRATIQIRRSDITPQEVAAAIDVVDYTALPGSPTAAQLSTERRFLAWLTAVFALPTMRLLNDDGSNGPIISNFQAMFGAATGTRTRLIALASRNGSRGEQLFGAGTIITSFDVARALRLT
jgi:hypothetical protein